MTDKIRVVIETYVVGALSCTLTYPRKCIICCLVVKPCGESESRAVSSLLQLLFAGCALLGNFSATVSCSVTIMDPLKFISLRIQESTMSIRAAEKELQKMRKQHWRLIRMYMNLTELKTLGAVNNDQQLSSSTSNASTLLTTPGEEESDPEAPEQHRNSGESLDTEDTQLDVFAPVAVDQLTEPATLQQRSVTSETDKNLRVVKIESLVDKDIKKNDPLRSMEFESEDVNFELVYLSPSPESANSPTPSKKQKKQAPTPRPVKNGVEPRVEPSCSTGRSRLCRERKKWQMLATNPEIKRTIKKIICHECKAETFQGQRLWSCCAKCFNNYVSPGCHQSGEIYLCSNCRK